MTQTFTAIVAAYFAAHPHQWINADVLMEIGGRYAFRTRMSECRRQLLMPIRNRQSKRRDGSTLSEYRYEPGPQQQEMFT